MTCIAVSPDGKRTVSGSGEGTLRLWDADNGSALGDALHGHTFVVASVAFSPDGKRIAPGSSDKTLRIWPVLDASADALRSKCNSSLV